MHQVLAYGFAATYDSGRNCRHEREQLISELAFCLREKLWIIFVLVVGNPSHQFPRERDAWRRNGWKQDLALSRLDHFC